MMRFELVDLKEDSRGHKIESEYKVLKITATPSNDVKVSLSFDILSIETLRKYIDLLEQSHK